MADNETFIDLFPDADPDATARPAPVADSLDPSEVLGRLPRWQDDDLEMVRTLGEGGMGIVRLARQPALGRDVAVKTLRRSHRNETARWQVLQEAWAAGSLEHPNIVPVYSLGLDNAEMPYIVLKRLEGERWTDRLRRPDVDLEDHLRVLERVTQAVAYAHAHGVLHRDLKPDNVMIGAFDEVTLIDWGLAVTVRDDPDRRLPRADKQRQPAGTPAYMAPEQLAEDGARPSTRTDVYLLGGLLYRILHGRSPHGRGKLEAVIDRVRAGLPELGEALDPEARALLGRAMAQDPAQRPADASAFLQELQAYRRHVGARALLREADGHAERLHGELAAEAPDPEVLQQALGACRFGYQQARKQWPEAPQGKLEEVLRAMVAFHLGRDEPGAASVIAGEIDDPALARQLEKALAEREARRVEAELLAKDMSVATAVRTRAFVMGIVAVLWVVAPLVINMMGWQADVPADAYVTAHGMNLMLLVLVAGLSIWARDSMSRSLMNRYLRGQLFGICFLQAAVLVVCQVEGIDVYEAVARMQLAWLAMSVCNVALVGWSLLPMLLAFLGSFAVSTWDPSWSLLALGAANTVLLFNVVGPWMPLVVKAWNDPR